MKVIVDKNNPITILDQDGNVLFDYQPVTLADNNFIQDAIMEAYK